jgi:hypothetical protein
MFKFLIVLGVVVFALACRTYRHPSIRRTGALAILGASFLAGYFLSGSAVVGILSAGAWFLLPWLEILTRIRAMRLPLDRALEERWPPGGSRFPELEELTEEIEGEGFVQLADIGWSWQDIDQFIRVFFRERDNLETAIFFTEQSGMGFYHTGVVSRTPENRHVLTWDYPFSYTMSLPPDMVLHRVSAAGGNVAFGQLVEAHLQYLETAGIDPQECLPLRADELHEVMGREMRRQVEHNLDLGIITLAGEGTFRYSVKGYFFLWSRIIRDMIRLV